MSETARGFTNEDREKLTTLGVEVKHLKDDVSKLVSKDEFTPVKYIAYGLASGVLITVLGAVLAQAISKAS